MTARPGLQHLASGWFWRALVELLVAGTVPGLPGSGVAQGEDWDGNVAQAGLEPLPGLGGPRALGESEAPLTLGSLRPSYSVSDVTVQDSTGPFSLVRHFTATSSTWLYQASAGGPRHLLAAPFGTVQSGSATSLLWWHSLYSFVEFKQGVHTTDGTESPVYQVRDTSGRLSEFDLCDPAPCFAPPLSRSEPETRLLRTAQGFVLYKKGEGRLYYETAWPNATFPRVHFLSRIEDGQYPAAGVAASHRSRIRVSLDYGALDAGCGFRERTPSDPPYLRTATTGDGTPLHFTYAYDYGSGQCVLQSLGFDANHPLLTYQSGQGRVYGTRDETGRTTSYSYTSNGTDSLWRVDVGDYGGLRNVTLESLEPTFQYELAQQTEDRLLNVGVEYAPGTLLQCPPGSLGGGCAATQWQTFTYASPTAPDGTGQGGGVALKTSVEVEATQTAAGTVTLRQREQCVDLGVGSCDGIPDRALAWQWGTLSNGVPVTRAAQDRRSKWAAWDAQVAAPPDVPFDPEVMVAPVELTTSSEGASAADGTGALRRKSFTYVYGSRTQPFPVYEQLPATTTTASALPSAQLSTAQDVRFYDESNRLAKVLRIGNTQVFDGTSWTVVPRYVATFFFTDARCSGDVTPDPKGRTREVHGPCIVPGPDATDCPASDVVPITRYTYSPGNARGYQANRLLEKSIFPRSTVATCRAGDSVDAAFGKYDARGHVLESMDANHLLTTHVYQGDFLLSSTALGQTTTYTYDFATGQPSSVHSPAGNNEVFCYRAHTPGPACWGGIRTKHLQWKATSSTPAGDTWTQKVRYDYQDGRLVTETFLGPCAAGCTSSSGEVRRIVRHFPDAYGRATAEQVGDGPGSFGARNAFDAGNNLTGIGFAYNAPPAFCAANPHTGFPFSPLCAALSYDAVSRPVRLVEFPDSSAPGTMTCIDYDAQDHVRSVKTGCPQSTGDCGACPRPATTYQYDDFGNVVAVTAPWTDGGNGAPGTTRYEYDALGNLLKKQTPAMAQAGDWLRFSYDAMSRLLSLEHVGPGVSSGSELLYANAYDETAPQDSACTTVLTRGRLQMKSDSFGKTWYRYDAFGHLTASLRARALPGGGTAPCSIENSDANPNSFYRYNQAGQLVTEVYPHGRVVHYGYYPPGSGSEDRLQSISVETSAGLLPLIGNIRYEPYGGVSGYEVTAPLAPSGTQVASVEYLLGDDASQAPTSSCGAARPSNGDVTGRLRALWVSRGPLDGSPGGDILKQTWTWQADQLQRQDTCLLGSVAGAEQYMDAAGGKGYDGMLRLAHASRPPGQFATTGGAFGRRDYTWDGRGNRLAETRDCWLFQGSYNAGADQLTGWTGAPSPSCQQSPTCGPATQYGLGFSYDADGRVFQKRWPTDSTGGPSWALTFSSGLDARHAAVGAVYRSVQTGAGLPFEYFYDSGGRRRLKVYPTGVSDEFFWEGTELREDRGNASVLGPGVAAPYSLDEYLWLEGRPVAFLRSSFDAGWHRNPDLTGQCARNGESTPCGVYFIVSDYLGKPVLLLDSQRRVAGSADYEPFGHVNRVTYLGDTPQPYPANDNRVLAYLNQPPSPGTTVQLRARYALVDTASRDSAYAYLSDDSGSELDSAARAGGPHQGNVATGWVTVPAASGASNGRVHVRFTSDATANPGYSGITFEGYEYRRFEAGASPVWTPLRFPGQYHDAETDLFENWNRFYDPSVGRYLGPEPRTHDPERVKKNVMVGLGLPTYGYANNNALFNIDPDGLLFDTNSFEVSLVLAELLFDPNIGGDIARMQMDPTHLFDIDEVPADQAPDEGAAGLPNIAHSSGTIEYPIQFNLDQVHKHESNTGTWLAPLSLKELVAHELGHQFGKIYENEFGWGYIDGIWQSRSNHRAIDWENSQRLGAKRPYNGGVNGTSPHAYPLCPAPPLLCP